MQTIKNVKVEQHCIFCKKKLHSQMIIAKVSTDFKISELSRHVVINIERKKCLKHPEAIVNVTHTHHHKEILQ